MEFVLTSKQAKLFTVLNTDGEVYFILLLPHAIHTGEEGRTCARWITHPRSVTPLSSSHESSLVIVQTALNCALNYVKHEVFNVALQSW